MIAGEDVRLELAENVPVKAVESYTIVGQSVPRTDLLAKATGELVYVHDVRVPACSTAAWFVRPMPASMPCFCRHQPDRGR